MRRTRPAGAIAPPLYAADAAYRAPEIDIPQEVDEASIYEEWDHSRGYCACVRWAVDGRPYSARMGAREWATAADAPIFVDEWRAGPLTDSEVHGPEICFRAPSERWWSSARVVRTAMVQLETTQRVPRGDDITI